MSLEEFAAEKGIRQFLVSFTDLCGVMRSKLVPASAIAAAERDGAGFAGFAAHLDLSPADPDIFAMPDARCAIQLPWRREVAWVPAELTMEGKALDQAPRNVLARVVEQATVQGVELRTGVECEFFLLHPSEHRICDPSDSRDKPCYDQQVLFRHYNVVSRLSEYMEELGWGPYQADHEDANGQFEMNWEFDRCMVTADRHAFFKFMVQSVAEEEGFRATFMAKPFAHLTGNGCHVHCSLWDAAGENLFTSSDGACGLSATAYGFLGGIMAHARAIAAIANPTVNSYKRIHAPTTSSGSTWSPRTISYSGNNRTHMVRIPDAHRFEIRLADGSANPYLLPACILAAGLDGLERGLDPGERIDADGHRSPDGRASRLPETLPEALGELEASAVLRERLGGELLDSYLTIKRSEWRDYQSQVSGWEVSRYLNA